MAVHKRLIGVLAGMAFYVLSASSANAVLVNSGFETGDLTGWSATIPDGGSAGAVTTGQDGITPLSGNWMAELKTDGPGNFITLAQSIFLGDGDSVHGFVNWFNGEAAGEDIFNDQAFIEILDTSLAVVDTPFFAESANSPSGPSGWTPWWFTASTADTYIVLASIANGGDDSDFDSYLYLDNTVPEPTTILLLGLGLAGLGFARRRLH